MKKFLYVLSIFLLACTKQAFGSEAGMPQLNPEFWTAQIFWLLLIFFGLYLIIWKVFLPKITFTVENRKSKIVNDLDESQKLKDKAEKKLEEYNQIIENAKKEAKKIIDENRKKLDQDIDSKKNKFNKQIEDEIKVIEKEIKILKKSSIEKISSIAEETATELVKQIVDSSINRSSVAAAVNEITKKKTEKYS